MASYFVKRCGSSNRFNGLGWIGSVEARGAKAALEAAHGRWGGRTYDGQYLEVVLASRCGREAHEEVALADEHEELTDEIAASEDIALKADREQWYKELAEDIRTGARYEG